jgi:FkbM family methyltransferase
MKTSTQTKLQFARLISRVVCSSRRIIGKSENGVFRRRKILYDLNLKEGIDLSIYLFGVFEPDVVRFYDKQIRCGSVAVDIGANIGAHTLEMAARCGNTGMVVAVEPTAWAFSKLQRNIYLNPALALRIKILQAFLNEDSSKSLPEEVCSSWPMDVQKGSLDARSEGRAHSTRGANATSLDALVCTMALPRVDLLKIDVDGNELQVLRGGVSTLRKFHPAIIIELAPYVFNDGEASISSILELLSSEGYDKVCTGRRVFRLVDHAAILKSIPDGGGVNSLIY